MLPGCFAGRWFQNRDTVRQRWSVNSIARRGSSKAHLPFSLAADFVPEEGTRFQQIVSYAEKREVDWCDRVIRSRMI